MFDNYVHILTISLLFVIPGIAHRDLKPENILCESPEKVQRADLGDYSLHSCGEATSTFCWVVSSSVGIRYQPELADFYKHVRMLYRMCGVSAFPSRLHPWLFLALYQ